MPAFGVEADVGTRGDTHCVFVAIGRLDAPPAGSTGCMYDERDRHSWRNHASRRDDIETRRRHDVVGAPFNDGRAALCERCLETGEGRNPPCVDIGPPCLDATRAWRGVHGDRTVSFNRAPGNAERNGIERKRTAPVTATRAHVDDVYVRPC
ncbi:MAG TPA: hypothetical protein VFN41_06835 [Candidatus Limnocylindrales bacterium]|nr:hypothetical protein [Candidatus Limnocylindrales bacterium]